MRVQTKSLLLSFLLAATLIPDGAFGSKCDCCPCPCTCECEEVVPPTPPPVPTGPPPTTSVECRSVCLDLALLVDGSSSISSADWVVALNFLAQVATSFDIGFLNTVTAVIQFGNTAYEEMGFGDAANADSVALSAKYASFAQRGGVTALTDAIDLYLNTTRLGLRTEVPPDCAELNEAVVIITDGLPNQRAYFLPGFEDALQTALGENIFGVAVGEADKMKLAETVGSVDRVFEADDFGAIYNILDQLISTICKTIRPETTPPPVVEVPAPLPINKCQCCCPPPVPVKFHVGPWTPKCEGGSDSSSSSTGTSSIMMTSSSSG